MASACHAIGCMVPAPTDDVDIPAASPPNNNIVNVTNAVGTTKTDTSQRKKKTHSNSEDSNHTKSHIKSVDNAKFSATSVHPFFLKAVTAPTMVPKPPSKGSVALRKAESTPPHGPVS